MLQFYFPNIPINIKHCALQKSKARIFPRWKKFLSDDGPQTSFDLLKLTKIAGAGTYVDVTQFTGSIQKLHLDKNILSKYLFLGYGKDFQPSRILIWMK